MFVIIYADNIDIAETENRENPYVGAKKKKEDGGPIVSSEISATCSEKLNLSRKQFFIWRKKTMAALGPIHVNGSGIKEKMTCKDCDD